MSIRVRSRSSYAAESALLIQPGGKGRHCLARRRYRYGSRGAVTGRISQRLDIVRNSSWNEIALEVGFAHIFQHEPIGRPTRPHSPCAREAHSCSPSSRAILRGLVSWSAHLHTRSRLKCRAVCVRADQYRFDMDGTLDAKFKALHIKVGCIGPKRSYRGSHQSADCPPRRPKTDSRMPSRFLNWSITD
jgi:hypothetical protein